MGSAGDTTGGHTSRGASFDIVPTAIYLSDIDGRIVRANATHCRVMGLDPEGITRLKAWEQSPAQEADRLRAFYAGSFAAGANHRFIGVGNAAKGPVLGQLQVRGPEPSRAEEHAINVVQPITVGALSHAVAVGQIPDSKVAAGPLGQALDGLRRLSPRERAVFTQIIGGRSVVAIADDLGLSASTVRNHLQSIYRCMRVRSRDELHGLVLTLVRQSKEVIR